MKEEGDRRCKDRHPMFIISSYKSHDYSNIYLEIYFIHHQFSFDKLKAKCFTKFFSVLHIFLDTAL
jgi:hypothetical protein